jgi:hypothetical protein
MPEADAKRQWLPFQHVIDDASLAVLIRLLQQCGGRFFFPQHVSQNNTFCCVRVSDSTFLVSRINLYIKRHSHRTMKIITLTALVYFAFTVLTYGQTSYSRPTPAARIVKAQAGDTVAKVAKHNGLLPTSVLGSGREIRLPARTTENPVPCKLSLAESPALRGIRLGMTAMEVTRALRIPVFPVAEGSGTGIWKANPKDRYDSTERKVEVGETAFRWRNRANNLSSELADVDSLSIDFFNDRAYLIYVRYKPHNFKWKDSQEMVSVLSESLKLNGQPWETARTEIWCELFCEGFSVLMTSIDKSGTDIMLTDVAARDTLQAKIKETVEAEDKTKNRTDAEKKRAFKP